MTEDDSRDRGEGAAERALSNAVPGQLRESLVQRARHRMLSVDPPHPYLKAAPGATVASALFAATGDMSRQRLRALEASDEQFAVSGRNVPLRAGDYVLRVGAHDVPQLRGIHERASLTGNAVKFILLPGAGFSLLGMFFVSASSDGLGPAGATALGALPALLLVAAFYYLFLLGRGAVTGHFLQSHFIDHKQAEKVADVRRYYLHATAAINSLSESRAWRSEILAAPRVQINLDEESAQLADFALTLEKLRVALGERPVGLGEGPTSVWESRAQTYRDGVASLKSRAESLIALNLAVADVETRMRQLAQLQSPEADDLVAKIVRSMPNNELAAAHVDSLTANVSGVAEALQNEVAMLTATADELARAAASLPQLASETRPQE